MPGSVYGTEDTKVNSQGKPGAYHHKDHIPGGGGGGGASQETSNQLDKYILVVMRAQKQGNTVCSRKEGQELGRGCV